MAQTFLRGAKTENLSNGAIFAPFLCRAYTHGIILYRYILFHILIYNRLTNARQPVFIRKKHCCTAVFLRHLYAAAATVQAEREFSQCLTQTETRWYNISRMRKREVLQQKHRRCFMHCEVY